MTEKQEKELILIDEETIQNAIDIIKVEITEKDVDLFIQFWEMTDALKKGKMIKEQNLTPIYVLLSPYNIEVYAKELIDGEITIN